MKFLIDAQLPYRLSKFLNVQGHDVKHTNQLPDRDRTTDNEICILSIRENRILITKDTDFVDSYHVKKSPSKLLFITTGNINNQNLISLFEQNIDLVCNLFESFSLIEMTNTEIIVHD
jgi:predicted nuclease of predicted toxin-antitoxin system